MPVMADHFVCVLVYMLVSYISCLLTRLEDLTIGELGDLLKGYRALAAFYHSHKKDES
jgi:hypothetical protein